MPSPIEDYAIIGDCHTAALVGRDGAIDWLCFPRFDSGACFAALLGTEENGRWLLAPSGKINNIRRRYRAGTLVLETDYETDDGVVTLIDCMPPRSREPDVVRVVVGRRGQVRMRMQLVIRFDYGANIPWVRRTDKGIRAIAGPDALVLQTNVALRAEGFTTTAEFTAVENHPTYGCEVVRHQSESSWLAGVSDTFWFARKVRTKACCRAETPQQIGSRSGRQTVRPYGTKGPSD